MTLFKLSLYSILSQDLANQKNHADCVAQSAKLLSEHTIGLTSISHAQALKDVGRSLAVSAQSSKAKLAGLELLRRCFERWPGEEGAAVVDTVSCLRLLVDIVTHPSKNTPNVRAAANWCMGTLCK